MSNRDSRLREGFRQSLANRPPRRETISFDRDNQRVVQPQQPPSSRRHSLLDPKWEQLANSTQYGPVHADRPHTHRTSTEPPPPHRPQRPSKEDRIMWKNARRETKIQEKLNSPRRSSISPQCSTYQPPARQSTKQNKRDIVASNYHHQSSTDRKSQRDDTSNLEDLPSITSDESFPDDNQSRSRTFSPDDQPRKSSRRNSRDIERPGFRVNNDRHDCRGHSFRNRKFKRGVYNQNGPDLEGVSKPTRIRETKKQPELEELDSEMSAYSGILVINTPSIAEKSKPSTFNYSPPSHKTYITRESHRPKDAHKAEPDQDSESSLSPPPSARRRQDRWTVYVKDNREQEPERRYHGDKKNSEKQVFVWRKN